MTGLDPSEFPPDGMSVEEFARASGVDPDNVLVAARHRRTIQGRAGLWSDPCGPRS